VRFGLECNQNLDLGSTLDRPEDRRTI